MTINMEEEVMTNNIALEITKCVFLYDSSEETNNKEYYTVNDFLISCP
jgi:hypothetical protein